MTKHDEYEAFLADVDNRSWARCDTLSGEQCMSVQINGEGKNAVLIFECRVTNKPHIRTVILNRPDAHAKWRVQSENTINLPNLHPTPTGHLVTTSNTPDEVPSVTPSITLTGKQVDRLHSLLQASVDAMDASTINKANDAVTEALARMIGFGR